MRGALIAAAIALASLGTPALAQSTVQFSSPQAALNQGLGAYRSGFHKIAEQALGYAADNGLLLGRYYLSRLYADPNASLTDHARAFKLLYAIVREHAARIDVDDDPNARYVGKSLTALGGYWLRGLPEIGVKANAERAAAYFQEAATFFRDQDAQFELAKLYLTGEGVPADQRRAIHWLSTLSQTGHPGAQAFLADLYWRGRLVPRDQHQALALISLAVENAPAHERIWIEHTYQTIYCGMSADVRQQSEGLVASFRHRYAPRPGTEPQESYGDSRVPVRACADGTPLPSIRSGKDTRGSDSTMAGSSKSVATGRPKAMQGSIMGIGVKRLQGN